jgi:phage shock protein C
MMYFSKNLNNKEMEKKLIKSKDKKISGVAAGVAEYFGVDPTMVRVAWAVLAFLTGGVTLVAYLVCWFAMPEPDNNNIDGNISGTNTNGSSIH